MRPTRGRGSTRSAPSGGSARSDRALARDSAALAVVMGCWVLLTPWAFRGVHHPGAAFWSDIATGSLVFVTASVKAALPSIRGVSWVTLAAGGWLMVSSMALDAPARPATSAAVVGLLIVLASLASTAGTTLAFGRRPGPPGSAGERPRRHAGRRPGRHAAA